ncbi:spore germination protein [Neobacillus terrae]|uniref:spore germination protein n=1 Tax=Neobacillus terrae TaxID=3034837 RepID=UPI00140C5FF7|nr:spore germination protein [Neobacillus terrae]NHM33252.1 spore germination protein [Neobacillus terrae]
MFWKQSDRDKSESHRDKRAVNLQNLKEMLSNMEDAEIIERETNNSEKIIFIYIRTLINQERLNEAIVVPLIQSSYASVCDCITNSKVSILSTLKEAETQLLFGSVLVFNQKQNVWCSVPLKNTTGRSIETSETETILYGAKDSFSEQIETNITLIRRRLPKTELKVEKFTIGTYSETTVMLMYIDGLTNPEFVKIARNELTNINFDLFFDSSQIAAFMEDHHHSIFPQFLQTDRPDVCAYSLVMGKITMLIDNTPFALVAPITFFHLLQSPEDYINRWPVASFLRGLRYISFIISITLIPFYVALTTHHYEMIPLQILYVLVESRSKLPFTPFWEAFLMLIILEIIKEASLRMPTKSSQTLGVIGGIVIGQAAVEAGFASKVLIVLVGISTIAAFLCPNYLLTKANTLIQFIFLIFSSFMGIIGIALGMIGILAHLNGLTSLKQPYFAPVSPFYGRDWLDLFIRGPLIWMKRRPEHLRTLQKWRYRSRR